MTNEQIKTQQVEDQLQETNRKHVELIAKVNRDTEEAIAKVNVAKSLEDVLKSVDELLDNHNETLTKLEDLRSEAEQDLHTIEEAIKDIPLPKVNKVDVTKAAAKGFKETLKAKWNAMSTHEKWTSIGFIVGGIAVLIARDKASKKVLAAIDYSAAGAYGTHLLCEGADMLFNKAIPTAQKA